MLRKNLFWIGLALVLISAWLLCVYSIWTFETGGTGADGEPVLTGSGVAYTVPGQGSDALSSTKLAAPNGNGNGQLRGSGRQSRQNAGEGWNRGIAGRRSSDASKYVPQLISYSIIFLGVCILLYILVQKHKIKIRPAKAGVTAFIVLGLGLLLRLWASMLMEGHPYDMQLFRNWAESAANGLTRVYSEGRTSDYPPLYFFVLFLVGKAGSIAALHPYFTLLLKLPSILADVAAGFILFRLAKKRLSIEMGLLVTVFYVFNPAVFINSTFWGQVDSFFALLAAAAIILLAEGKPGISAVLFTAAVLMKPQGIIFLPVLFFELVRLRRVAQFVKAAALALGTVVLIVLPFAIEKGPLWIVNLYLNTVGEYRYASVNAFNFFGLLGANYAEDSNTLFLFSYHTWGMIAIVLVTAFTWMVYAKAGNRAFAPAASLMLIAGVFTFSARMHERYLFPAALLALLAFLYLKDRRFLLLAAGYSISIYINTHYVLYQTSIGINRIGYDPVLVGTSLLNVALFVCLVIITAGWSAKRKEKMMLV